MRTATFLCLLLVASYALCATYPAQVQALKDLYVSTNGDQWTVNTSWNFDDPCFAQWYGIMCTSVDGYSVIQSINLSNNNLRGPIPESFGNLLQLTIASFYNNFITSLPQSLGRMQQLSSAGFDSNRITTVPSVMYNAKLSTLSLSGNLIKQLPEFAAGPTRLNYVYASNNLLTSVPSSLNVLTNLNTLYLQGNQISSLPADFNTTARTIYLSNNTLTGGIPDALGRLSQLYQLDISNNRFSGSMVLSSKWANLNLYNASRNQFTGGLDDWAARGRFYSFDVSRNQFSNFPNNWTVRPSWISNGYQTNAMNLGCNCWNQDSLPSWCVMAVCSPCNTTMCSGAPCLTSC